MHSRRENFGCGTRSNYLAYSIESQVAGFIIQASVIELFYRKTIGVMLYNIDVGGGILSR